MVIPGATFIPESRVVRFCIFSRNEDFNGKGLSLNCFYMYTIFGQKYPKPAVVTTLYTPRFSNLLSALLMNSLYLGISHGTKAGSTVRTQTPAAVAAAVHRGFK